MFCLRNDRIMEVMYSSEKTVNKGETSERYNTI